MDFPQLIISKLKDKYRDSSIKTLKANIKRLFVEGLNLRKYKHEKLFDFKRVEKYIKTLDKKSNQKTMVAAIIAFLNTDDKLPQNVFEKYKALFNKIALDVKDETFYKAPTMSERSNKMNFADIEALRDKKLETYRENEANNNNMRNTRAFLEYLILCLYTYLPPLRGEEYLNCIVLNKKISPANYERLLKKYKKNFVDLRGKKFVIGFYKTSATYGMRMLDLSDKLVEVIKEYMNIRKLKDANLLLDGDKPFIYRNFYNLLHRIFKPYKISTSMLRKIYISDKVKDMEPDKRKELAKQMGHSLMTQEFIYNKFKT